MAARAAVARWSRPSEAVRLLLSGAMTRPCLPLVLVVSTVLSPVDHADAVFQGAARGAVTLKGARQVRQTSPTSGTLRCWPCTSAAGAATGLVRYDGCSRDVPLRGGWQARHEEDLAARLPPVLR